MTMIWMLAVLALLVGIIVGQARKGGADRSALGAAEAQTKAVEAAKANMEATIGRVEDATLGIHDRATAIASLSARHPSAK